MNVTSSAPPPPTFAKWFFNLEDPLIFHHIQGVLRQACAGDCNSCGDLPLYAYVAAPLNLNRLLGLILDVLLSVDEFKPNFPRSCWTRVTRQPALA